MIMMKNICVVGCGKIGRLHSRKLSRSADLFFHSHTKSSAVKLNRQFNGKGVFSGFDKVLKSPSIDAVVIASPPEFHKEQIVSSLQAGKSVLVEKPMCISNGEIDEIEEAMDASDNKAFLMVAENYYYKPALKKIKHLLKERIIGDIQSVRVKKEFAPSTIGWRERYGALIEGGIHYIAFISDIFDDAPKNIRAHFPGADKGKAERSSIIKLKYKNNAEAQLTYAWKTNKLLKGLFQKSSIVGEKGKIIFESNGIYILLVSEHKVGLYFPNLSDIMGYSEMIKDFLSCLMDDTRTPYSDFHKAKRDLAIIFRAYEHLRD